MASVPISDVVPLNQWIQAYHDFHHRLTQLLQQTGQTVHQLHLAALGAEVRPGVWDVCCCVVYVQTHTVSVEVADGLSAEAALRVFEKYQRTLFGDAV